MTAFKLLLLLHLATAGVYLINIYGPFRYAVSSGKLKSPIGAGVISIALSLVPIYNLRCVIRGAYMFYDPFAEEYEE